MDELGAKSPWFSQEFIEAAKRQTQMVELNKRYNLSGELVPYTYEELTCCSECGRPYEG